MGPHSFYIWISYGIVFGGLAWFMLASLIKNKKIKQKLSQSWK